MNGRICAVFETIGRTFRVVMLTKTTAVEVVEAARTLTVSADR